MLIDTPVLVVGRDRAPSRAKLAAGGDCRARWWVTR
jgi:hypothetical protein